MAKEMTVRLENELHKTPAIILGSRCEA